jgi:hypothetical protein
MLEYKVLMSSKILHNMGLKNLIDVSGSCHTIAPTWTNILKNNWSKFSEQSNATQTMMLGPPQESLSTTQSSENCSPRLRHTLFLPSAVEMQ